jgi:plasmid stability protein
MGQIIVRKLEDSVKEALRLRARKHGVSLEEEVRNILRNVAGKEPRASAKPEYGLGTEIANLFRGVDWGDEVLEELPDTPLRIVKFDE